MLIETFCGKKTYRESNKVFKANKRWFLSFIKHMNLKVTRELAPADKEATSEFPKHLKKVIKQKKPIIKSKSSTVLKLVFSVKSCLN